MQVATAFRASISAAAAAEEAAGTLFSWSPAAAPPAPPRLRCERGLFGGLQKAPPPSPSPPPQAGEGARCCFGCCCIGCIPQPEVEGTTLTSGDIGVLPSERSCCGCLRTTAGAPFPPPPVPAAPPTNMQPPPLPGTQFPPGRTGIVSVVAVALDEGEGSAPATDERGALPPAAAAAAA